MANQANQKQQNIVVPSDEAQEQFEKFYQFQDHLLRGGSYGFHFLMGPGEIQTKKGHKKETQSLWFPVDSPPNVPDQLINQHHYFGINPTDTRKDIYHRSENKDIVAVNCVFAEHDYKSFEGGENEVKGIISNLPIEPSVTAESGGGIHSFLLLKDTFLIETDEDRKRIDAVQQKWVTIIQADEQCKDRSRVLRTWGTLNMKAERRNEAGEFPMAKTIKFDMDLRYSLEEIETLVNEKYQELIDKGMAKTPWNSKPPPGTKVSQNIPFRRAESYVDGAMAGIYAQVEGAVGDERHINVVIAGASYGQLEVTEWAKPHLPEDCGAKLILDACEFNGYLSPEKYDEAEIMFQFNDGRERYGWERDHVVLYDESGKKKSNITDDDFLELVVSAKTDTDKMEELFKEISKFSIARMVQLKAEVIAALDIGKREFTALLKEARKSSAFDSKAYWTIDRFEKLFKMAGYNFRINEMNERLETIGEAIWINNTERAKIRCMLRENDAPVEHGEDAILAVGDRNRYHPIREFLHDLEWDGTDHIARLASYVSDEQGMFGKWLYRWFLMSVALMHDIGHTDNFMPIFIGDKGIGKSTFAKFLCPIPKFFNDSKPDPTDKDTRIRTASYWIWEAAELRTSLTRKRDIEGWKLIITMTNCAERKAYERDDTEKAPCVAWIGTTNPFSEGFLGDEDGSRRFISINLTNIDKAYLKEVDISQVWAQAMHVFADRGNDKPWILNEEEARIRDENNFLHGTENLYLDKLPDLFELTDNPKDMMTTADILHVITGSYHSFSQRDLANQLSRFGAKKTTYTDEKTNKQRRCWKFIKPIDTKVTNIVNDLRVIQANNENGRGRGITPEETTTLKASLKAKNSN